MGKASQRAQAERRMVDLPERIREQAEWDAQNLPRKQGDALGCPSVVAAYGSSSLIDQAVVVAGFSVVKNKIK